jgi:transposase InsO family protein
VEEVDRSVSLYNTDKPHKALNYKTPMEVEKEQLHLTQQTKLKMTESLDVKT